MKVTQFLSLARVSLMYSLLAVAAAALLVWGSTWRLGAARAQAQSAASQLQQTQSELVDAQDARQRLENNLRQFKGLQVSGFVGVADRIALLETVETAAGQYRGANLRWELESARVLETVNDARSGSPVADVVAILMRLQSDRLNEDDWLELMAKLRQSESGQLRVQGCDWQRDTVITDFGVLPTLRGQCDYLWTYIVPAGAKS